jgi:hypothetical protein
METNMIPTPCSDRLRATSLAQIEGSRFTAAIELMRTSETTGLGAVKTAPHGVALQGTGLSAAASATAYKATALLPISDVVVFDGFAGCRFWSPPV